MLRHVTAGVDGSAESLSAAHWAAREALRRGAPLRIVHAWRSRAHPAASVPVDRTRQEWAERTLDQAVASVRAAHPGLRIAGRLVSGPATTGLLSMAGDAELLVLGSRGLTGVAGFLLGSVSQQVVARSSQPVVLVRAGETSTDEHLPAVDGVSPEEIPVSPYRDVVLGLDTRRPCDELIEFAFTSARRCGGPLHVVHAFRAPSAAAPEGGQNPTSGPGLLAAHEHSVVAALRPWCEKFPEVSVTETVAEGRAATELVRASARAALVVVGRRTRDSRFGIRIGPVAHAVLHHCGCPVAVVPHA
ncbi:universal stress protein [Streptomyces sp. NPDC053367]|uniref:universal stress protein n=1 Tax=Streptomyces sp. NPDC053367 TaxID=3365700 RepID=UPI0037D0BBFA